MGSAQLLQRCAPPRVLVVGGGPVGLSMGFLLDKVFNVPTRIVERQTQPTTHPQAHFLNLRTMEVLQATMPGFHDRLQAHAAPSELWRDYIYCTGVGKAREFARIDQFGPCIPRSGSPAAALEAISPTQFLHFPQNRFESMLSDFLQESDLHVDRGVELLDLKVDPAAAAIGGGGCPTTVSLRHTETQQIEEASFDFVIGADGAHSLVRQLCGIDMAGALNLQSIVNVHFTSKALSEAARENPAMLYFIFNKDVIGVLIAHDLSRGEWVFQIPFFPPQESVEWDFSTAQCLEIIQQILPLDVAKRVQLADDARVLSVGQWRMSARVAKQYDAHRQVFLVGDAAHQFPPAGGFGMNTGIQDAHNLAWKLALTMQQQPNERNGVDASKLLRSYERERQQVAKINTQLSLHNVERTMKIPNALNVSHNNAKLLATIANSKPLKLLPLQMQRDFVQNIMKVGKAPLGLLDSVSNALGGYMRAQAKQIVERRESLGMLFYHFDIGFSYDSSSNWAAHAKELMQDAALDTSALFVSSSNSKQRSGSDGVFAPEFCAGTRFPHFWVSPAEDEAAKDQQRESTLTLGRHVMELNKSADGTVLFLLVVDGKKLDSFAPTLEKNGNEDLLKHVALVVLHSADQEPQPVGVVGHEPFASVHHWRVASDASSRAKWEEFADSHAAALVRPDGHVGFLWSADCAPQSSKSIVDALHHSYALC